MIIETNRYLERINYSGKVASDLLTLQKLQRQHIFYVPFENLDIYYKIPVVLDIRNIYNKIVVNNRGGYCYELNSLFCELLRSFGFNVSMISGRVTSAKGGYGHEFDHMALAVEVADTKWLVDVGFGDFSLKPLAIDCGRVQSDGRKKYRIMNNTYVNGKKYMSVEKWNEGKKIFQPEYIFTLTPHKLQDFADMNDYQQTSPDSGFVRSLMCSLPTANGRISIVNNRIVKTIDGVKYPQTIRSDTHRQSILRKYFNINFEIPEAILVER